jgi:hypothetical protein
MLEKILKFLPIFIWLHILRYAIAFLQIPHSFVRIRFVKPEVFKLNEYSHNHKFIFIYASIEKEISESSSNILKSVRELGGFIVLVTNRAEYVFDEKTRSLCDIFIDNKNTGWDFSQYKRASHYIYDNLSTANFSKVIYANDSVFYLPNNLTASVSRLLDDKYDVMSFFDGVGRLNYHFASWFISVSKETFLNEKIRSFWNKFFEVKNKYYAVMSGEYGFSKALISLLPKTCVTYNGHYICTIRELNLKHLKYMSPKIHDHFFDKRDFHYGGDDLSEDPLRDYVSHNLAKYSIPQVFAPLLVKYCDMPFIKRDLFWNEFQSISSIYFISSILREKVSEEYQNFIKAYYLRRGFLSGAKFYIKIINFLGIR